MESGSDAVVKGVVVMADLGRWADTELSVLYDIFYETGTRLMGEFVALRYAAREGWILVVVATRSD